MKYIYLIVIIFLIPACSYYVLEEDYNYLPDNSLRFIRTKEDTSILINKDDKYYLLLLGEPNIDIEVNYLIKYKDIETNIEKEEEYLLNEDIIIDNIEFNINNKIEINMNNYKICIYMKELDRDDYSRCNFIYLYNIDSNFYITLNNDLLMLFYHSYTKFNYRFLYHMSSVWIDSSTIDTSSYTTLTLEDNSFQITNNKIRGNTVHRR